MFGWKKEYIVNKLSFEDVNTFYIKGKEIDLRRRGFDLDQKPVTQEEREELHDLYYTDEEKRELEKYKEGLVGK